MLTKIRSARAIWITTLAVVVLAVGVVLAWHPVGRIVRGCPSARLCDFVDTLRVPGFHKIHEGSMTHAEYALYYAGASGQDLTTLVTGLGMATHQPKTRAGVTFEELLAEGQSTDRTFHGCGV